MSRSQINTANRIEAYKKVSFNTCNKQTKTQNFTSRLISFNLELEKRSYQGNCNFSKQTNLIQILYKFQSLEMFLLDYAFCYTSSA